MNVESIQTLYRYNEWANRRILDMAGKADPAQFQAATILSFGSVHDTLVHIMACQWLWLNRWQGLSPQALFDPKDFAGLEELKQRWEEIERETRAFVLSRTEDDLGRLSSYRNFKNVEWTYPLWQQMVHQVNHATQHRSEAAVFLSAWGCSPGSMDFLFFVDAELAKDSSKPA